MIDANPVLFEHEDSSMIYFENEKGKSCGLPYTLWRSKLSPNHCVMVLACAVRKWKRTALRELATHEFCSTQNIDPKTVNQGSQGPLLSIKFLGE